MSSHYIRPTCSHCMYWSHEGSKEVATVGHCHRYPPGIHVNPQTGTVIQKFPTTEKHHWCGEWSDDDQVLQDAARRSVLGAST